jgi:hypothetical protein
MNVKNLRTMVSVRASIDCFAFADGRFCGPDTGGAFERFRVQRESEQALISGVLSAEIREEHLLTELNSDNSVRRALAAKLIDQLMQGGAQAMLDCARRHRSRIELVRVPEPPQ